MVLIELVLLLLHLACLWLLLGITMALALTPHLTLVLTSITSLGLWAEENFQIRKKQVWFDSIWEPGILGFASDSPAACCYADQTWIDLRSLPVILAVARGHVSLQNTTTARCSSVVARWEIDPRWMAMKLEVETRGFPVEKLLLHLEWLRWR